VTLKLWRLYHLEAQIKEQSAALEALRAEHTEDEIQQVRCLGWGASSILKQLLINPSRANGACKHQQALEAEVDAKRREQGQLRKELLALDKQLKKKETEIDKQVRAAGR